MPVYAIDTLKPKNGLNFPVVEAIDVAVEGYLSLADAVTHFATDTTIASINAALEGKSNKAETNLAITDLQNQINGIITPVTEDAEVINARSSSTGKTYATLKSRLDRENAYTTEKIDSISETGKNLLTINRVGTYNMAYANFELINTAADSAPKTDLYIQSRSNSAKISDVFGAVTTIGTRYSATFQKTSAMVYLQFKMGGTSIDITANINISDLTNNKNYTVSFTVADNRVNVVNGFIISDIQLEEGSTATEFTPKTLVAVDEKARGQIEALASQLEGVESIVDEVTVEKYGKNIFTSEWSESGKGISIDTGADTNVQYNRRTGYVAISGGKTYTMSTDFGVAPSVYVYYYDENKNYLSYVTTNYGFYPKTITTPSNAVYMRVSHDTSTPSDDVLPTHYQIEEGSTATAYEPPSEPETMIPYSKITDIPTVTGRIQIAGKKWLFLGDSITANTEANGWVYKFKQLVDAHENSYIQAVGGAQWCDSESGIIYNGEPYNSQNFIGNQVVWCQKIGFSSSAFDCVIISAGTNDTNLTFPNDTEIETEFYTENTLKSLDSVDRSTWQGAIRWSVQTLRSMYPNAKIVLITPIQRKVDFNTSVTKDMYPIIRQKREIIDKMARRLGAYYIDMAECNITDLDSSDFTDGLHPSNKGSTKMAEYIFRKIMPIMGDYI